MILLILQILAAAIGGCIIGYFLIRIFTKLREFYFIRQNNKIAKELEQSHKELFYNTFGFYYEDVIKYAPEFDTYISSKVYQQHIDNIGLKMIAMRKIYDAMCIVEQIDIMKFKQTIENIKNQKALETIDG